MSVTPEQVFTPRADQVNPAMYVARPELESALISALKGSRQPVLYGESGSGKSWLYKHVLAQENTAFLVADLANASRFGSITREFENIVSRAQKPQKVGFSEQKGASIGVFGCSGGLSHTGEFRLASKEPYEQCLELVRNYAVGATAAIVLDNFERILDDASLIKELANIIALTDNADYAAYRVKLLIVGVPHDLRLFFAKVDQQNTVANRLVEIPEVARLPATGVRDLVARGLVQQLKIDITPSNLQKIADHVAWVSDRIPQPIHEYCLELATIARAKADRLDLSDLDHADFAWVRTALLSAYAAVEVNMNSRQTAAGRRNQTIFALGRCDVEDFRHDQIEALIRREFPTSTSGLALNVPQLLTALCEGESPLLRRTPNDDAYHFINPRFRMAIRTMLRKDTTGNRVEKLSREDMSWAALE